MNLRDYFRPLKAAAKDEFARRAGTSRIYIHQLVCQGPSRRRPSEGLALRLRRASGDVVSLASMRPDLWPESTSAEYGRIELDPVAVGDDSHG